jgi:hypothetical protein
MASEKILVSETRLDNLLDNLTGMLQGLWFVAEVEGKTFGDADTPRRRLMALSAEPMANYRDAVKRYLVEN